MPAGWTLCEKCKQQPAVFTLRYAYHNAEHRCEKCMLEDVLPARSPLPVNGKPVTKVNERLRA